MEISHLIKSFNKHQSEMFNILNTENLYQFRVPTGVGKGYVMIGHILNSVMNSENSIFTIASHRLSLNNQHLRDLIDLFIEFKLLGKVRFLTVGSSSLNIDKLLKADSDLYIKFNNLIFDYNIDKPSHLQRHQEDTFLSSMDDETITKIVESNNELGIKTIIISTYNSLDKLSNLDIDISYLDEAHILASNKAESDFRKSFEVIKSKKKFFFTATPKDMQEEILNDEESGDIFLMNNESIFGKSYEVSFIECVKSGYITEPVIHVAHPKIVDGTNYDSIENKSKFIRETFWAHREWVKSNSSRCEEIDAKILVRCESVPNMWEIYHKLMSEIDSDIIVCAGASYGGNDGINHVISGEWIRNRDEFLKKIQGISSTQKVIILNFDVFSEGINLFGITGVMFMQGKMASITKVIQNVGRSTRLHPIDRKGLIDGSIKVGGSGWVKPNCAVIIPYWDGASEFTKNILADLIRKLRSKMGFSPSMILSVGDDFANSDGGDDLDDLNKRAGREKKWKLIDEINQEIEKLDLKDIDEKEREKIQKMSKLELLKKAFGY
jgi:hypothetical protein